MLRLNSAVALAIFACTFSVPAAACLCSCSIFSKPGKDAIAAEVGAAGYDQVFSGFIIGTERIDEPAAAEPVSSATSVDERGYWTKSRVLVLRIWQGTPSTVTDVWTHVVTDCDPSPSRGTYFVALVRYQEGRNVARNSSCDCARKAAATQGSSAFAVGGITIAAAALGTPLAALLWLVKIIQRRKRLKPH
jgi:hypothetical protein